MARLGQDAASRGVPRRIDDVGVDDISRWLGTTVTGLRRIDGTSGTTDRARLALEGPDAPASVFLKVPAAKAGIRLFGYLAGLGENEVRFYRDVRPELDLDAPTLLGSSFDRATKRFVIVLDDLAAAGATFVDARSSLDPAEVGDVLANLARLHGRFWCSTDLSSRLDWVFPNRDDPLLPAIQTRGRWGGWRRGSCGPRPTSCPLTDGRFSMRTRRSCAGSTRAITPSCTATRTRATATSSTGGPASSTGRCCGAGTRCATSPTT